MLVKPLLATQMIVDGTIENTITFISYGGDQYVGNEAEIYNNATGVKVWTLKTETMTPKFVVPVSTLTNGTEYKCRVRTYDRSSVNSEWSDYMIINCLSDATVSITNIIGGVVKNQKYVFTGTFTQSESVLLKSFTYLLYDSNKKLLKQYTPVYQTSGTLQQLVEGMDNNTTYHIELKCIDQYNQTFTSGLIQFYVEYKPPRVQQILHLENNPENAAIDLSSEIIQLIFKQSGTCEFIDDRELNLKNGSVYLDNIDIYGDFSLQLWARDFTKNQWIFRLKNDEKRFVIECRIEEDDRVHVYKKNQSITSHYSNPIEITALNGYTIYIQQVKGRIGIEVGVINV